MTMRSHYLQCEGRELHYTEWGSQHTDTVIAWHGLARTCRDMDDIAEELSQRYRVICPDIRGMGWTDAPRDGYHLRTLTRDLLRLLDVLGLE